MLNDQELLQKIDEISGQYTGQMDELYKAIGILVVGRLYGWRVMRLSTSFPVWRRACKITGDLVDLMPERGIYAHKSFGLRLSDQVGHYWEILKGTPGHQRPMAQKGEII
jgi:hypothetical protein